MKIHGLQKMTLLDYPGKVACTVFLGGCNFRCPYCHNFELVDGSAPAVMDSDELLAFLGTRRGLLDGVAVTGGEPCLHAGLPGLLSQIRDMGFAVKLDTNGCFPDVLAAVVGQGLVDYVAMDVKNGPSKYARSAGLATLDLSPVLASIGVLLGGGVDYEFRTTVVAELHDENDFHEIGKMIAGARRYFLQSFVDRDTVPFSGFHSPSAEQLELFARIASAYVPATELRGIA